MQRLRSPLLLAASIMLPFLLPAAVLAAGNYSCDSAAEEALVIAADNRGLFGVHIIGLVERQELQRDGDRLVCKALGLLSNGGREEVRYTAYREFGEWWIQYEAKSDAGYSDDMLLESERAGRAAELALLPEKMAALLTELNAFPAEFFGPDATPLTIQLELNYGILENISKISATGTVLPLALMDERDRAVMLFMTSTYVAPLWELAAPVASTWTFTATPTGVAGNAPRISWPGQADAPLVAAASPELDALIATPSKTKTKTTRLCDYTIDRVADGVRQGIGSGRLAVEAGRLRLVEGTWFTDGQHAEAPFANFALTVRDDGSVAGSIPVFYLFAEPGVPLNEPITAGIDIAGQDGTLPLNARAEFPIDHVFTGELTLRGCGG